jgi:hypothetical protein
VLLIGGDRNVDGYLVVSVALAAALTQLFSP